MRLKANGGKSVSSFPHCCFQAIRRTRRCRSGHSPKVTRHSPNHPKLVAGKRFQRKHRLKAPLFVLVVQHHHRHNLQRMLTAAAGRSFAFQVLNKTVREVIRRTRSSSGLRSLRPALWTGEFHTVFEGIAVQRCPAGVSYAYSFQRVSAHNRHLPSSKNVRLISRLCKVRRTTGSK